MTREQKDKANAIKKRWAAKNRDKIIQYKRKHYHANRDKYMTLERDRQYRKRYGITLADYDAMLAAQGGGCAICGSKKSGPKGFCFAVDHCHKTGAVRGLLCNKCNSNLGWIAWYEQHRARIDEYLGLRKHEAA